MRAMLLRKQAPIEDSPLQPAELDDPLPAPNELRVRITCCAVCRTDLHIIEGDLPPAKLPLIPGHQIVGIVDSLGPGCKTHKLGSRVGIAWLRHTDGTCRFCTSARENLCPQSKYTGYDADGGYADLAIVPEDFAYTLPDSFSDIQVSPLLCAGIIGYRALLRSNLPPDGKLAIFGFGSSAHIVIQIAIHRGHPVYVVSRNPNHQALARSLGAAWADSDPAKIPHKVQSAIVFAPAGSVVPPALDCLDRGGTVSLAGIHMSPIPPLDYDKYLFYERDIHPVTANTRSDARDLLQAAAQAHVKTHTVTYPLSQANQALRDLKEGRIDGTAVLIP